MTCFSATFLPIVVLHGKDSVTRMLKADIFIFLLSGVAIRTEIVQCSRWFLHRCAFVGQTERVRAVPLPVCQVVCAACKPPDVSETSHWRRGRGGEAGGERAATAGRVGWLPRGLGCHQEPCAQTADLAHTWTRRLSLGKNKADPICARWDELTALQNARTGAVPSKQPFGRNHITGRCWCDRSSDNCGSVPRNEGIVVFP